jgi:hypothetical protein
MRGAPRVAYNGGADYIIPHFWATFTINERVKMEKENLNVDNSVCNM